MDDRDDCSVDKENQLIGSLRSAPSKQTGSLTTVVGSTVERLLLDRLDKQELDSVPKYVVNRLTLERVNDCIDQLNKVIQEKYSVLRGAPQKMSRETRQRYWAYKESVNAACKGKTFITDADIQSSKQSRFRLDPLGRAVLAILRHLQRVKESRGGGLTRFIATAQNKTPLDG